MRKQDLLSQRIKELNYLTNDEDLVFCLYPFSFALKELIQSNLEESNYKRKFTSSIEETKNFLYATKNKYIVFISEYLTDGPGTNLLMELKNNKVDHNCIIFLNGKDKKGSPLISKTMHDFMLTNRISDQMLPLRLGPIALSGYGWNLIGRVMIKKGLAMSLTENGEFGWSGAGNTYFWIDRKNQLTGIIMTQYIGGFLTISDEFRAASYSVI